MSPFLFGCQFMLVNLLIYSITIDYYWDTQENREENRTLVLHFKDCLAVDYKIKKAILEMSRDDIHFDSLFTIIRFENVEADSNGFHHFHIYTFDYTEPLLQIICKQVQLEECGIVDGGQ